MNRFVIELDDEAPFVWSRSFVELKDSIRIWLQLGTEKVTVYGPENFNETFTKAKTNDDR